MMPQKKERYKRQLLRKWGDNSKREDRPNLYYPIKSPDGKSLYPKLPDGTDGCWRWGKDKMLDALNNQRIEFAVGQKGILEAYEKIFESDEKAKSKKFKSLLLEEGSTAGGTSQIKMLFSDKKIFDRPKPTNLADFLARVAGLSENDIILDFFAGSCTTAHAVMQLNAEDGGNRQFIMVQLPEPCDEKSEAYQAGYRTIADIGRERIRRAAKKIKADNPEYQGDVGFKSFTLAPSNFKVWESDVKNITDLEQQLLDHIDHVDPASSPEDILYELLLNAGFPLTATINKVTMAKKEVFSINNGAILICLDETITADVIDAMAAANPQQVICLDKAFHGNDQLKVNAVQTFKSRAQQNESEIVFRTV